MTNHKLLFNRFMESLTVLISVYGVQLKPSGRVSLVSGIDPVPKPTSELNSTSPELQLLKVKVKVPQLGLVTFAGLKLGINLPPWVRKAVSVARLPL